MKKQVILILIIFTFVVTSNAKSTKLVFTWMSPNYSGGKFKNILVLAMNGRASGRADFEDLLAEGIARPDIQAVPSYSLLPRRRQLP